MNVRGSENLDDPKEAIAMKKTLLCALAVLWGLAISHPAHAIQCGKSSLSKVVHSQTSSLTQFLLPVTMFVSVTQKPVVHMGKSVTSILRQILIGQKRTKGMPVVGVRI